MSVRVSSPALPTDGCLVYPTDKIILYVVSLKILSPVTNITQKAINRHKCTRGNRGY